MSPGRVIALVLGCLLLVPAGALILAGGGLGLAYATQRDDDGYFDVTLERLESDTSAISAEDLDLASDPGSPDWLLDALDLDVRLRVTSGRDLPVFVGIGPESDVDGYLAGVAHDEIVDFDDDEPRFRRRDGEAPATPPTEQDFWVVAADGTGTQEVEWEATEGRWAVVVMNADGSAGIAADVNVGAKAGFVLPLAFALLGVGAVLLVVAVTVIMVAALAGRGRAAVPEAVATPEAPGVGRVEPVRLEARLDPDLSRWKWLVKWFLAIPHFVVLVFLSIAFAVLTVVAGFAILFTGRYPQGIFDFNVGVLRWSWRVAYYATSGGLGTDRYPPFSLGPEPDYPATLDVAYPERLSRGLVLVKWWLLAIPHYVVVAILLGGGIGWTDDEGEWTASAPGLLPVLVLVAAVVLLFTGRYPPRLFDLIVGLARWVARVVGYAALMTDRYPPFRLDQGGAEPLPGPDTTGPDTPDTDTTDTGGGEVAAGTGPQRF